MRLSTLHKLSKANFSYTYFKDLLSHDIRTTQPFSANNICIESLIYTEMKIMPKHGSETLDLRRSKIVLAIFYKILKNLIS